MSLYLLGRERARDGAQTALLTFSYLIVDGRIQPEIVWKDEDGEPYLKRMSFDDRELLVVDESHALEGQTASLHAGFTIGEYQLPDPFREVFQEVFADVYLRDLNKPTVAAAPLREIVGMAAFYLTAYNGLVSGINPRTPPENAPGERLPREP